MADAVVKSSEPVESSDLSFTTLVQEHWSGVYRLLQTLTRNTHDTEDLTQETFLRAMNRIGSFTSGTNLRAWLLRIASNAFFDQQRKNRRRSTEALPGEPESPGEAIDKRLETREQSALVQAALEQLSETTRMVFHLRVQEELSFREIAELANTTEQSARWHMHQARTKLLEKLGDQLE